MNKKLLIVGCSVVALLIIMAVAVNLGSDKKDKTTANNKNNSSTQTKENKEMDATKSENLQNMLKDFVLNATAAQQTYPKSSAEGWLQFRYIVDNANYFKDPYTGNTYKYVSNKVTPDYDEIQYAPGYTCDNNDKDFMRGNLRHVAVRSRFSTGIKCISSVQIQSTDSDTSTSQ